MSHAKIKDLLVNICISFFVLLIALETVELYLHLTYKPGEPEPFAYSPVIGWENIPDFNVSFYSPYYGRNIRDVHNSIGIRDEHEFGNKTKPRILIIGDSFVYGQGLDQQDIIGRRLQEKLPDYEVISAGTIGYSTTQYLQEYQNRTRVLKPDIVVFAVYVNDFAENFYDEIFGFTKPWDYSLTPDEQVVRKEFAPEPVVHHPRSPPTFMLPPLIASTISTIRNAQQPYMNSSLRVNQAWYMLEQPLTNAPGGGNITGAVRTSKILEQYVLNETKAMLLKDNVTFIVVYIPVRIQADPSYRDAVFSRFSGVPISTINMTAPDEYLRIMASKINATYLDLLPAFSIAPEKDYLTDGHLSPSGTARFDEELYNLLVKEKLLNAS